MMQGSGLMILLSHFKMQVQISPNLKKTAFRRINPFSFILWWVVVGSEVNACSSWREEEEKEETAAINGIQIAI